MKNAPNKSISNHTDSSASTEAEELGRLLGVIAHEIKNPLSTIKVNLRLIDEQLQQGDSSDVQQRLERARRKLAIIEKEAGRLEQILDSFLRYADGTKPCLSPVDINSIVSDMVDFFLPQATSHSITMRQCLHKEPLICPVDAGMLKQAISSGGELMVRTARAAQYAQIQISDTGKGIPPERLAHIFEPYQSSRPNGTGLGLATVKKIIESHNGNISVVSEPGKGTAFTISLPLSIAGAEGDDR